MIQGNKNDEIFADVFGHYKSLLIFTIHADRLVINNTEHISQSSIQFTVCYIDIETFPCQVIDSLKFRVIDTFEDKNSLTYASFPS